MVLTKSLIFGTYYNKLENIHKLGELHYGGEAWVPYAPLCSHKCTPIK